jgi:hypothetical protein
MTKSRKAEKRRGDRMHPLFDANIDGESGRRYTVEEHFALGVCVYE